jgi:hypothetical protein
MTGPEHYQEAERLTNLAQGQEMEWAMFTLAQAQVHATLALAAATALGQDTDTDRTYWRLAMRGN